MSTKIIWGALAACVWSFGALADAGTPSWYQIPPAELRVQESVPLPSGYTYPCSGDKIVINPKLAAGSPTTLELAFEEMTGVTQVTFLVGPGGHLKFHGSWLSRVCIICEPGGEVVLEDCNLEQVWFSTDNGYVGTGEPSPKVVVERCNLNNCTIESPHATGLTIKNSNVMDSFLECSEKDGANSTASYSRCIFQRCTIQNPEVLLASSGCDFRGCNHLGEFSDTLGSYLPKPVLVRLAWIGGPPVSLPPKAGKVFFEVVARTFQPNEIGAQVLGDDDVWMKQSYSIKRTVKLANVNGAIVAEIQAPPVSSVPRSSPAPPPVETVSSVIGKGLVFKSRIVGVNGLLISQLSSGEEAGQVTKMSLTALPSLGEAPSTLKFNQKVGPDMEKALHEVSKFAQLRHGGLPGGHAIELGFADKYISKDGPSAAVACALLLEGAITGERWDPDFAVTGDMNADGSVQPIGGVQAKVRGATKGGCKIVGIPIKNEKALSDILVLEGPGPLVAIGIFGIAKFDDAHALASPERPEKLQNALKELENVRNVLSRMSATQMLGTLRSKAGQDRLRYILEAAPNCYSAKHLLLYAMGRGPRSLSIGGSIEAADSNAVGLIKSIESDVEQSVSTLKGDEVGTSINKLKNLRPKLDPRVWPYVDNIITYGEVVRSSILNPVRSGARYMDLITKARAASTAAKATFERLTGDPQVREELGL